jgi:hypothetical protein
MANAFRIMPEDRLSSNGNWLHKNGHNAPKMEIGLLSYPFCPCHQLQNDLWFTVMLGQKLMIWRPLEV